MLACCTACPHQLAHHVNAAGMREIAFCRLCTCHHAADGSRAVCSLHAD